MKTKTRNQRSGRRRSRSVISSTHALVALAITVKGMSWRDTAHLFGYSSPASVGYALKRAVAVAASSH